MLLVSADWGLNSMIIKMEKEWRDEGVRVSHQWFLNFSIHPETPGKLKKKPKKTPDASLAL